MQDNQRVLDQTLTDNKVYRQQARAMRDKQMGQTNSSKPDSESDPMGDILIDSPTQNHFHQPARSRVPSFVVYALLLAAGGAGTLGLMRLLTLAPVVPAPPAASAPEKPVVSLPATPAQVPGKDPAWDAITEQQQPDGSWQQIKREHLQSGK